MNNDGDQQLFSEEDNKSFRLLNDQLEGLEITRSMINEESENSFNPALFRGLAEVAPAPAHDPFAAATRNLYPSTQSWSGLDKTHSGDPNNKSNKAQFANITLTAVVQDDGPRRVLLGRPQWYEKHTSLFLTPSASPDAVFSFLESSIGSYGDTQFISHPNQFMMSAALFNPSCVLFDVSLYNVESEGILLEFHRTNGDAMDFFPMYKKVVEELGKQQMVVAPPPARGLRRFDLPGFEDEPSIDDEDFARLVAMSSSNFHDVAREGASALCHLSRHAANLPFLKANVNQLGEVSQHPDLQVKRCVATLLANISNGWLDGKSMLAILIKSLEPSSARPNDLVYRELRRQLNNIRLNVGL